MKCCRVFPMVGHLVHFDDPRLADMGQIESLTSDPAMTRWEKWHLKSVQGSPRNFDGIYQLISHNQAHHPVVYHELDFKKIPSDPNVDRMDHHWLIALGTNYKTWDARTGTAPPVPEFNKKRIYCDGHDKMILYDYSPFDYHEKSESCQRKTKRMTRHWRRCVTHFLHRTFTTNDDDAMCMIAGAF
jgi:hypothetical protein